MVRALLPAVSILAALGCGGSGSEPTSSDGDKVAQVRVIIKADGGRTRYVGRRDQRDEPKIEMLAGCLGTEDIQTSWLYGVSSDPKATPTPPVMIVRGLNADSKEIWSVDIQLKGGDGEMVTVDPNVLPPQNP